MSAVWSPNSESQTHLNTPKPLCTWPSFISTDLHVRDSRFQYNKTLSLSLFCWSFSSRNVHKIHSKIWTNKPLTIVISSRCNDGFNNASLFRESHDLWVSTRFKPLRGRWSNSSPQDRFHDTVIYSWNFSRVYAKLLLIESGILYFSTLLHKQLLIKFKKL